LKHKLCKTHTIKDEELNLAGENTIHEVDEFAGDVVSKTVYRHGRSSMEGTIIGMAQTFVGSNNVNLLKPRGQFGSRYELFLRQITRRWNLRNVLKSSLVAFHWDDSS